MSWINGDRIVAGDTAQGADIYHWRFAPRATTKRNIDWYFWAWSSPESIPWGGQVQDGGAVLGFSYHDLMARLQDARAGQRLAAAAGDHQLVRRGAGRGRLPQVLRRLARGLACKAAARRAGSGSTWSSSRARWSRRSCSTASSASPPGPTASSSTRGCRQDWPELTVDRIRFQNLVLRIRATREAIEIRKEGAAPEPLFLQLPEGEWKAALLREDGSPLARGQAAQA